MTGLFFDRTGGCVRCMVDEEYLVDHARGHDCIPHLIDAVAVMAKSVSKPVSRFPSGG